MNCQCRTKRQARAERYCLKGAGTTGETAAGKTRNPVLMSYRATRAKVSQNSGKETEAASAP